MLKDILNTDKKFHLVATHSDKAKIFIDGLFNDFSDIIRCYSYDDLKKQIPTLMAPPFFSSEWVCIIQVQKGTGYLYEKLVKQLISSFGVFIFYFDNYQDYKRLKSVLSSDATNDSYLNRLGKQDINFILGKLIIQLSEPVYKKLCRDYAKNIDAIFTLRDFLQTSPSVNVKTNSELLEICGSPDPDITNWVLTLANRLVSAPDKYKDKTLSEWNTSSSRSIRTIISKILPLCEDKSAEYVRVCLKNCTGDFIQIKQIYLQGEELDKEDICKKYTKKLDKIKDIPLDILIVLYKALDEKEHWDTLEDCLDFMQSIYMN